MKSKTMKLALILLVALAILGTAGIASATSIGNLSFNLSNGEITDVGVNYTGYLEFTPNTDFGINTYSALIIPSDPLVTITVSSKTDGLFAGYEYFDTGSSNRISSVASNAYKLTGSLTKIPKGSTIKNVSLTHDTTYKLVAFTIHVDSAITNNTVNLSIVDGAGSDPRLWTSVSTNVNSKLYFMKDGDLSTIPYMLNNSTANSVAILNSVSVDIETNATIFDGNVSVFSELAKKIANSSDDYYLNYTSSTEDVIKFYDYVNLTPKYVVLKGGNSSLITVNLTNKTTGIVIDSKNFTVTTNKISLGADAFNYTANHTYPYIKSKSVAPDVLQDVKKALLNHSVGAADSTDDAYVNGYVREIGEITLTFFNKSDCQIQNKVEPIEGGRYWFNVSIVANNNYNTVTDLQIANNSFVIDGAPIMGVKCVNLSNYNARNPAKIIYEFNATGLDFNTSVFNETTTVDAFVYNFPSIQLGFNTTNWCGYGVNCTVNSSNTTITFDPMTHPTENVTIFEFEGYPRGDFTMDGIVQANDAAELASYYANPSSYISTTTNWREEQKFYGNVKGSESIQLNDIRLISQYWAGNLNPDYEDSNP